MRFKTEKIEEGLEYVIWGMGKKRWMKWLRSRWRFKSDLMARMNNGTG